MKLSDVKIVTWISYDHDAKKYDFAIGFEGLDSYAGVDGVEDEFIRDMYGACDDPNLFDLLSKKSPESSFHRHVLRKMQKNMQQILEEKSNIYSFNSVLYDIEMKLLPNEY